MNMRQLSVNRKKACVRSQHWIEGSTVSNGETMALQQLGLFLCDRIKCGGIIPRVSEGVIFQLPALKDFVCMNRCDILEMVNRACLVGKNDYQINRSDKYMWGRIFGGMALSFARVGDPSVVAALLRSAAHLDLNDPWIDESEIFILDQQQPDGSFGLMAPELALQQDDLSAYECRLRLTVEILWAFVERENSSQTN